MVPLHDPEVDTDSMGCTVTCGANAAFAIRWCKFPRCCNLHVTRSLVTNRHAQPCWACATCRQTCAFGAALQGLISACANPCCMSPVVARRRLSMSRTQHAQQENVAHKRLQSWMHAWMYFGPAPSCIDQLRSPSAPAGWPLLRDAAAEHLFYDGAAGRCRDLPHHGLHSGRERPDSHGLRCGLNMHQWHKHLEPEGFCGPHFSYVLRTELCSFPLPHAGPARRRTAPQTRATPAARSTRPTPATTTAWPRPSGR